MSENFDLYKMFAYFLWTIFCLYFLSNFSGILFVCWSLSKYEDNVSEGARDKISDFFLPFLQVLGVGNVDT